MTRVILSTGKYAETPFYVEKVYANVYCYEELCYVLYENAFLIDKDIVSKSLADWIGTELGLMDLARTLYSLINQNSGAASFVGAILDYALFYSHEEIEKVESVLRMNAGLSVFEKWKAKADFLYENRHFLLAIKEYEHLLDNLGEDELELKSHIYNNMGVTYMALYLYDSARKYFMKSYEIDNNETAFKHYLTVQRLALTDDQYIKMIADREEAYRQSLSIEGDMERVRTEYDSSDEAVKLKELFELKEQKDAALYYEEIGHITERLKEDYRDVVLEAARSEETFREQ